MHINKGNAHGTQGERSNPANYAELLQLASLGCNYFIVLLYPPELFNVPNILKTELFPSWDTSVLFYHPSLQNPSIDSQIQALFCNSMYRILYLSYHLYNSYHISSLKICPLKVKADFNLLLLNQHLN